MTLSPDRAGTADTTATTAIPTDTTATAERPPVTAWLRSVDRRISECYQTNFRSGNMPITTDGWWLSTTLDISSSFCAKNMTIVLLSIQIFAIIWIVLMHNLRDRIHSRQASPFFHFVFLCVHWKEGSSLSCCKIMSCKLRQITPDLSMPAWSLLGLCIKEWLMVHS